jgi:hypothetical protein
MASEEDFPKYNVEEYWLIRDDKIEDFIDYYEKTWITLKDTIPGFMGWEVRTNLRIGDGGDMPLDAPYYARVGGPEKMIVPHPGVYLDGVVTNKSVNLHSLIRKEYNIIISLYFETAQSIIDVIPMIGVRYEEIHNISFDDDEDMHVKFYGSAINHWDVIHRVLRNTMRRPSQI